MGEHLTVTWLHVYTNVLFSIGMCNSVRVFEYSAVTAMIEHENKDRGKKILNGYSSTLGGTPSLQQQAVQRCEKREAWLWSHLVMSGLATYLIHIGCVWILTFIYMLNALHITSSFMLKCNARLWLLFETVILLLDVSFSKILFLSYLFNSMYISIKMVFVLRMASKTRRRF